MGICVKCGTDNIPIPDLSAAPIAQLLGAPTCVAPDPGCPLPKQGLRLIDGQLYVPDNCAQSITVGQPTGAVLVGNGQLSGGRPFQPEGIVTASNLQPDCPALTLAADTIVANRPGIYQVEYQSGLIPRVLGGASGVNLFGLELIAPSTFMPVGLFGPQLAAPPDCGCPLGNETTRAARLTGSATGCLNAGEGVSMRTITQSSVLNDVYVSQSQMTVTYLGEKCDA